MNAFYKHSRIKEYQPAPLAVRQALRTLDRAVEDGIGDARMAA